MPKILTIEACEHCKHWASLTWKCVHPMGHANHETAYPEDTCRYFEMEEPLPNAEEKEDSPFVRGVRMKMRALVDKELPDAEEKDGESECDNCNKIKAKWFEKGQMSVKRKNKSGCCCIIDDNDEVISVCGAHATWMEEQLPDVEGKE